MFHITWAHSVTVITSIALSSYFLCNHWKGEQNYQLGHVGLKIDTNEGVYFAIFGNGSEQLSTGKLGIGLEQHDKEECSHAIKRPGLDSEGFCKEWKNKARLEINQLPWSADCYQITWQALAAGTVLEDCFDVNNKVRWFGGGETYSQPWPLHRDTVTMQRYVSGDFVPAPHQQFGGVIDNYWLTSTGVGIYVSDNVPLYHGSNASHVCFRAMNEKCQFGQKLPQLNYTMCHAGNIVETHRFMSGHFIDRPEGHPDELMFRYPIWSSWARYKTEINQTTFLQFAKEIKKYNFPSSQLELDDDYTTAYGDFVFNYDKFPEPKAMLQEIHELGYRTTSWIIPFANLNSKAFEEGSHHGYFLMNEANKVPLLVKWWQGTGAIIDPANEEAVHWWTKRLNKLKQFGIDSFKFDAGEVCYLPQQYLEDNPSRNPGFFTRDYVKMVAKFGTQVETRVGFRSQRHPVFVRMLDKDSKWGYNNGLRTLIPTALLFSLLGYPFILPDMVGGNGYGEEVLLHSSVLPQKELFIRWLQVTTFLPSIQFSFVPWQYDSETIEISRDMVHLHSQYVAPLCIRLAQTAAETGEPIIRPLWWIAPTDPIAVEIDSEFLIGNDVLVTPVLDESARERDIYIPEGQWKNMINGQIYQGPQWLFKFPVALNEVIYFENLGNEEE